MRKWETAIRTKAPRVIYLYYRTPRYVSSETTAKIEQYTLQTVPYTRLRTWYKMVTANSVKFSSVSSNICPLLIRASQVARRSTLKACFLGFDLDTIAEYDNILCPSLCSNDLSSQAPHKSSPLRENLKISFKSVLGLIRFVLMLVLQFAKSRDVTSLLKCLRSVFWNRSCLSLLVYW